MKVCIITDNQYIYERFRKLIQKLEHEVDYDFFFSSQNSKFNQTYRGTSFQPINLKECGHDFYSKYNVFFSLHCKQIFPDNLVNRYRCINVHPGFNPYNRGWFPQVFSIINGFPAGVTIHEMDTELDHGPIIYQQEVVIESWETSYNIYEKILKTEMDLIESNLNDLVNGNYESYPMTHNGNLNYMKDFKALCKLDMNNKGTLREHLNLLRAMTFDGYQNAYYIENGKKIYVTISLEPVDIETEI